MIKRIWDATIKRCGTNPLYKALVLLEAAWAVLLIAGFFVTDLGRPDAAWAFALVARLAVISGLAVSHALYLADLKPEGYRGYKAFAGYAAFLSYVGSAIYAYARFENGKIGTGAAWAGWAASLVETAPGLALYFLVRTAAARVALGVVTPKEAKEKGGWKPPKAKTLGGKILDNADAVIQAVILVAVIHSTLFQLYVIPTESMVPKFLVDDRVIVTKIQSGPRVPLSPLKTPSLYEPKRGDIIVYDNPFVKKPPVLRRMANTLVFYLTLSFVNLDKEEDGQDRVGTVVKRLVGMPGEKLLMVDDVLYARKPGDAGWSRMEEDATWARTNLWKESPSVKSRIRDFRISETARSEIDATDEWKNALAVPDLARKLSGLADRFARIDPAGLRAALPTPSASYYEATERAAFGTIATREEAANSAFYAQRALAVRSDVQVCLYAVSNRERLARFVEFLRPAEYPAVMDPYEESSAKLNLALKAATAERWLDYLSLLREGNAKELSRLSVAEEVEYVDIVQASPKIQDLMARGESYEDWIRLVRYFVYYDYRNFPEFPKGDEYLGEGKYFLMGDNRYNSLDFRYVHDDSAAFLKLDAHDPRSVQWVSALDPVSLDRERILGKVLFTFWPPSSIGR